MAIGTPVALVIAASAWRAVSAESSCDGATRDCPRAPTDRDHSLLQRLSVWEHTAESTAESTRMVKRMARTGSRRITTAATSAIQNTMTEELFEWADSHTSKIDTTSWPTLESGNFNLGLYKPVVYVISLEEQNEMRHSFSMRYNKLGLQAEAKFFPGILGQDVPEHLVSPSGENATGAEMFWKQHQGVFGCFLAHMLVYRHALKTCPLCDVVIFEVDVTFHPRFHVLWTEFIKYAPRGNVTAPRGVSKPVSHYHIGGDCFWSNATETQKHYYVGGWISRTWGYVMIGTELLDYFHLLQETNNQQNMGIDQVLSGRAEYHVVTPKHVLVHALPSISTTSQDVTEVTDIDVDNRLSTLPGSSWHWQFNRPGTGCV